MREMQSLETSYDQYCHVLTAPRSDFHVPIGSTVPTGVTTATCAGQPHQCLRRLRSNVMALLVLYKNSNSCMES
jgi:hypothetical protein